MSKMIDMKKAHGLIMDSVVTAFECVLDQIEEQCAVDVDDTKETYSWETAYGQKFCGNCWESPLYDKKGEPVLSNYCPHCGKELV